MARIARSGSHGRGHWSESSIAHPYGTSEIRMQVRIFRFFCGVFRRFPPQARILALFFVSVRARWCSLAAVRTKVRTNLCSPRPKSLSASRVPSGEYYTMILVMGQWPQCYCACARVCAHTRRKLGGLRRKCHHRKDDSIDE